MHKISNIKKDQLIYKILILIILKKNNFLKILIYLYKVVIGLLLLVKVVLENLLYLI